MRTYDEDAEWARFDNAFPQDPDIDFHEIGAAAIGLWTCIVCTGMRLMNPRIPRATVKKLPGGNRRNLKKLCEAGWLIECDKGRAFFIRSLAKYASEKAKKKIRAIPVPESDPAPERKVSPRVSAIRSANGRKGGLATAAKRRRRAVDSAPTDVTNFDAAFATDIAKVVAKTAANESDFGSKNGEISSKNGHQNSEISGATRVRASETEDRRPEDINLKANLESFDLSPSVPDATSAEPSGPQSGQGHPPFGGPPAAERSKVERGSVDLSLWSPRKRIDVTEVATKFEDGANLRRLGQLWDTCDQAGLVGANLWTACITATESAKAAGKVRTTPGAMFRGMLANKLIEAGHPVPVGSVDERAEIHAAARASLATADDAESPPVDARDGPGAP